MQKKDSVSMSVIRRLPRYHRFLSELEHKGVTYMAFFPAVEEEAEQDDEEYGMIILKSIVENGEEMLSTLDSDEELNEVYDLFMEQMFAEADEEE